MKRTFLYVFSGLRSTLFLTALGCLLTAGLAGRFLHPVSARFNPQPAAAAQNPIPQIQALSAAQLSPDAEAQDPLHGDPLDGGSVLELRDGRPACRTATAAESFEMRRDATQQLRVLSENS